MPPRLKPVLWLLLVGAVLVGCQREAVPLSGGATKPAQAVRLLSRHLRDNNLTAFARDAVPAELHTQLENAWREGRTRWPLDELPLGKRLPSLLSTLSAPGAETKLQQVFDRQFAGANTEIKAAAASLGLFGLQYVRNEGDFSDAEREHYAQLIMAMSQWGTTAPLSDRQRARMAIQRLVTAARKTGLATDQDFARLGMQQSLQRLARFQAVAKQVLARYGLSLDASLDGLEAGLQTQTGDRARVRMRYTLGGQPIDTVVEVERHDGYWYLSDFLRHAEAAVASPTAAPTSATR